EKRKELYAQDNEELYDNGDEEEEVEEEGEREEEEEEEVEEEGEREEEEEEQEYDIGDIDVEEDELGKEDHCSNADASENIEEDIEDVDDNEAEEKNGPSESRYEEESVVEEEEKEKDVPDGNGENATKVLSETYISGNCSLPLPDSLSQWFNRSADRLQENPTVDKGMYEEFVQLNALAGNKMESKSDLLNLCSGSFPSQNSGEQSNDDDDEEMVVRKKKTYISDENGGYDEESKDSDNDKNEDGIYVRSDEHQEKVFNRVMIDSDVELEGSGGFDGVADDNEEVDSDDEMAVFRKQERERRRDWVEEEAELSGDDVGSDGEEEEELLDHYEAEEGDLDRVPDDEELRVDLHKQLMKQQESSDHRELLQLRERLLGDDVTGSDTNRNRTFRLKLREDEDGMVGVDDEENKEEEEEIRDESNIDVIKRRMEIEKEKEADDKEELGKETRSIDAFSSINRSTICTNRLGGRVRASLLHMNSSKMLGKENVIVNESRTFFVSKESNDDEKEKECINSLPVKRKSTIINENTNFKKSRNTTLSSSSVFCKFT
ncbi:hypothetical protein PMAYCL1PPCAC_23828, partial [Pristionchus mayeri]